MNNSHDWLFKHLHVFIFNPPKSFYKMKYIQTEHKGMPNRLVWFVDYGMTLPAVLRWTNAVTNQSSPRHAMVLFFSEVKK